MAECVSRSGQRVRRGSYAVPIHPDEPRRHDDDMAELKLKQGDLVEVYNDNGSTQAMAYPTPTAKRKQTFMQFAFPTGVQGNVASAGVNEFIIPNYKHAWGNIRKLADAPEGVKHLSFKSLEYTG